MTLNLTLICQKMIRTEFRHCTVITIAHRIESIMDSDYILVMSNGTAAEFAPPDELLKRENGLFTALVKGSIKIGQSQSVRAYE